ncbi:MAG: GNAT family N-acetyltransferase [Patescibacteria group bacterium]|nr:GNAT family N-acetyltransferase [Patescibacteria group bacterium]
MENYNWYQQLKKPSWAPPGYLFGPVWTFLYVLIAVSFGKVFWMAWQDQIGFAVALPFILNLIFNFSFTPIQFGLKNNILAAVDVLLVLGTLIWGILAIYPFSLWVIYAQIPYILWVSFATVLQLTVTYLNFGKKLVSIFGSQIKKEITNFSTGEKYEMLGGADMVFSDDDIKKITKICSQKNAYDILFKKRLNGKPYTEEDARSFVKWIKGGWNDQTHFVFIVRKQDSEIIGAIDIKSRDLNRAEIGYWADENYRGFMTNAVVELCSLAKGVGYAKLFAGVLARNSRSIGVLERAGFKKIKEDKKDGEDHFQYEKALY